jgi:hypothetical protein
MVQCALAALAFAFKRQTCFFTASAFASERMASFYMSLKVIHSRATSILSSSFKSGIGVSVLSRATEIKRADEEGMFFEQVK